MSTRIKQIESLLTRVLSQVLSQQMSDPRVAGLVSVTSISVSRDLRHATVGVSVLPKRRSGVALHALRNGTSRIHHLVMKQVTLRRVPHFEFKLDETIERHAAVLRDIEEGMRRERERHESIQSPDPEPNQDHASRGTDSTCPEDQS